MAFYVVEIPHQMPPVAWTAKDEAELIAKVNEYEYTEEMISDYDAAVAAIERDRYIVMVFANETEAREAIARDETWAIHQGFKARAVLRDLLD